MINNHDNRVSLCCVDGVLCVGSVKDQYPVHSIQLVVRADIVI